MMSRKDYVAFAAVLKSHIDLHARNESPSSVQALEWLAGDMAGTLATDNPRFDRARFLKACGVRS